MEVKELGDRPINIITKRLEEIQNEKEALSNFSNKQYEIEEERQKLGIEIKEQENEIELLKELRNLHEKQDLEKQKVKINENMVKEYKEKIQGLQENDKENSKIDEIENKKEENEKLKNEISKIQKKVNILVTFSIVFLIIAVASIFVIKNGYGAIISGICFILTLIYSYTQNKKKTRIKSSKKTQNVENQDKNLEQEIEKKKEIEMLEKSTNKLEEEINKINEELKQEYNFEKEKLRNKYIGKVQIKTIDEKLEKETVIYDINMLQNKISENKIKLHSIDLDKNNIIPKLENLANLEEEYENLEEQYEELCKKNEQIELVKEEITKAYETMKKSITPKFTKNLSKIIEKISDGKYKNIKLDEEKGMIVEIENGNYIQVKNLSVGTIDELYLSLRLGAGLEISNETLPVILDETFAYWDNTRLQNILNYLNEEFKTRQIILFTCTNREEEILNKLGIKYNKIKL